MTGAIDLSEGGQLSMKAAMAGEFLEGFGQARTEAVCLTVVPPPFLSCLLLLLAGICSSWQAAENPVFAIAA